MEKLLFNIKELFQVRDNDILKVSGIEMATLPSIKNAWLLVKDGHIEDFGSMENSPEVLCEKVDLSGQMVLPTWCDSHTHLVFSGNREQEFVDRINGLSYEEIAARGGGILNSAEKLRNTSFEELLAKAEERILEIMKLGTGAVEIKSGYGLTVDDEIKMLRVVRALRKKFPITVKSTFLGAHAFPKEFKENREGYVDLIINEMIPKIARDGLADYIDVFCEVNYFTVDQTNRILEAARKFGMTPKIHVNQFTSIGGIEAAINHGALSVDHLEVLEDNDIEHLKNSQTMPVVLPTCSFFIGIPFAPARKIIDAGLPLAIATDFNPGTTPSGNMNFVISTACIRLNITPEEAINAATINGAYAMGLEKSHGSVTKGKVASLIISKTIDSIYELPYFFGSNLIDKVMVHGEFMA